MKRLDRNKINKKYVDDILEYFIYEIYSSFKKPVNTTFLTNHLEVRVKEDLMNRFIIDYRINVHLSTIDVKRDERISMLLGDDDHLNEEYYIEVAYRMSDRSLHSVKISEDLLNSYEINS
jgi:hypothetical protein